MYIQSLKFEKRALRAIREEEAYEKDQESRRYWNSWMPMKVYATDPEYDDEIVDEELYEGGSKKQRT